MGHHQWHGRTKPDKGNGYNVVGARLGREGEVSRLLPHGSGVVRPHGKTQCRRPTRPDVPNSIGQVRERQGKSRRRWTLTSPTSSRSRGACRCIRRRHDRRHRGGLSVHRVAKGRRLRQGRHRQGVRGFSNRRPLPAFIQFPPRGHAALKGGLHMIRDCIHLCHWIRAGIECGVAPAANASRRPQGLDAPHRGCHGANRDANRCTTQGSKGRACSRRQRRVLVAIGRRLPARTQWKNTV